MLVVAVSTEDDEIGAGIFRNLENLSNDVAEEDGRLGVAPVVAGIGDEPGEGELGACLLSEGVVERLRVVLEDVADVNVGNALFCEGESDGGFFSGVVLEVGGVDDGVEGHVDRVRRCIGADGEDGAPCAVNDAFGARAEDEFAEAMAIVGSHDDQVGINLFREIDDGACRVMSLEGPAIRPDTFDVKIGDSVPEVFRAIMTQLVETDSHHGVGVWGGDGEIDDMRKDEPGSELMRQRARVRESLFRFGREVSRDKDLVDVQ